MHLTLPAITGEVVIYWDSEVQPAEKRRGKRKYVPSVVAWINTDFDSKETKINWFPTFDEFVNEASMSEVLVGFNTRGFDIPNFANSAYPPEFAHEKSFDFLWYLQEKVTGNFTQEVEGLSLDTLAEINLDRRKIKLQATAADLYRTGQYELLEAYVSNDAQLLYALVNFGLSYGFIQFKGQSGIETIDVNDLQYNIDRVQMKGVVGW